FGGIVLAVLVIVAVGVGGFLAIDRFSDDEPTTTEPVATVDLAEATIVRTDLIEYETLEGLLQFRDPGTVFASAPGTITALPEGGSVLGRGDIAYELNGSGVVTFIGDRPAWRTLEEGVANGPDVEQLETNLARQGFDDEGEMTVDTEFTPSTAAAIEAWQESLDREVTGLITPADIVFISAPVRVGSSFTETGATVAPGSPVFGTSARDHEVIVLLDADRQDLLVPGDEVDLELPDGTMTTAVVSTVSRIVTTDGEGPDARRVVEVTIDLEDESFAGDLDATPVDIDVETSRAASVLAVPVEALLALAEGGYAVEVDTGEGSRFVAVETGTFADGLVEVSGDIAEGDTVLVPE
ncbi:peptidoglycan-binding protein, partial [Ilumatobacter sp.]|uniref:peptidoglycan-binding protein n=1 Tax=Ilumatobacter sp. TaxID=1967498 RepID=UPI003C6A7C9C